MEHVTGTANANGLTFVVAVCAAGIFASIALAILGIIRHRTPTTEVRNPEASPYARTRDHESDDMWRELDQLRHPSNRVYNHQEDGL